MNKKPNSYASEAETQAMVLPDARMKAERKLAQIMVERGADEQGAEAYLILRQIAVELLAEQPAQQEQEPFCYHDGCNIVGKEFADHSDVFPLYTRPQAREPLTDEQIEDLLPEPDGSAEVNPRRIRTEDGWAAVEYEEADAWSKQLVFAVARAIEAAHGIGEKK